MVMFSLHCYTCFMKDSKLKNKDFDNITIVVLVVLILFFLAVVFISRTQPLQTSDTPLASNQPSIKNYIFTANTGTGVEENQYYLASSLNEFCLENYCQSVFIAGNALGKHIAVSAIDPEFIKRFQDPYRDFEAPFYIALGDNDKIQCLDCYLSFSEISSIWKFESNYYEVKEPGISFYVLDTNTIDQEQINWLATRLAVNSSKKNVVVGHADIINSNNPEINELKELICRQVDMFVSGQLLALAKYRDINDCNAVFVNSGMGSSTQGITIDSIEGNSDFDFFSDEPGYIVLRSIDGSNFEISFYSQANNILFQTTI